MTDTNALRRALRARRLAARPSEHRRAQSRLVGRVLRLAQFRKARRVALYIGVRGELDASVVALSARGRRKTYCLPVLDPLRKGVLRFCRWRPGERMRRNRFGIPEPIERKRRQLPAQRLDLVLVPLVGFDAQCNRLGMGGGFYDRTFAFTRSRRCATRPYLLGIAYAFQRVERLQAQPWDVPLDAVATDRALYRRLR
jgi:5-formyltetrahydrofolate cyclo-ligase